MVSNYHIERSCGLRSGNLNRPTRNGPLIRIFKTFLSVVYWPILHSFPKNHNCRGNQFMSMCTKCANQLNLLKLCLFQYVSLLTHFVTLNFRVAMKIEKCDSKARTVTTLLYVACKESKCHRSGLHDNLGGPQLPENEQWWICRGLKMSYSHILVS